MLRYLELPRIPSDFSLPERRNLGDLIRFGWVEDNGASYLITDAGRIALAQTTTSTPTGA